MEPRKNRILKTCSHRFKPINPNTNLPVNCSVSFNGLAVPWSLLFTSFCIRWNLKWLRILRIVSNAFDRTKNRPDIIIQATVVSGWNPIGEGGKGMEGKAGSGGRWTLSSYRKLRAMVIWVHEWTFLNLKLAQILTINVTVSWFVREGMLKLYNCQRTSRDNPDLSTVWPIHILC